MSTLNSPPPEAVPCQRHPQTQTRLRCTECKTSICPQCMIMYEVGFKCPNCAKKRPTHAENVIGRHYLIGSIGGFAAGQLYGWFFPWLSVTLGMIRFFSIPVLAWLVSYGLGQLAGKLLQQILHYKHHPVLTGSVLLSTVLGLLSTAFLQAILGTLDIISSAINSGGGTSVELFLLGGGLTLFSAVFFIRGLLQPFSQP